MDGQPVNGGQPPEEGPSRYYIQRDGTINVSKDSKTNIPGDVTHKEENQKHEETMKYDKCYYKVSFRTDHDIYVTGFEFLGPAKGDVVKYDVEIIMQVEEEDTTCWGWARAILLPGPVVPFTTITQLIPEWIYKQTIYSRNGKIILDFRRPVPVEANRWTVIKFLLDGPETKRLLNLPTSDEICIRDGPTVHVDLIRDSHQLSKIFFDVKY